MTKHVGRWALGVGLGLVCLGCSYPVELYCDETTPCTDPDRPFCDLEGEFEASEGISNTCIPAPQITSDAGPLDAAESDGSAGPDAPATAAQFDVAHVSQFYLGTAASSLSYFAWVRLVNTGTENLDLSGATVTDVIDDHAQMDVTMAWSDRIAVQLQPGRSGGALTQDAAALIGGTGLVTEPAQDIQNQYVEIRATNIPTSGSWLFVNAEGTLTIGNARATIRVTIVSSGSGSQVTPMDAIRSPSAPTP